MSFDRKAQARSVVTRTMSAGHPMADQGRRPCGASCTASKEREQVTNTVTYRRFATTMNDTSLGGQQAILDDYLARAGATAAAQFVDVMTSGMTVERSGLEALLEYCSQNPGTRVLIASADRISRSVGIWMTINARLARVGAELVVAT